MGEATSRRVAAVNETLNDILLDIESEEREEAANYMRLMHWCQKEVSGFTELIEKSQEEKGERELAQKELEASLATYEHDLKEIEEQVTKGSDEMSQAESLNKQDLDKYEDDLDMNMQSIREVTQAVEIVGKVHEQGGFLQNGLIRRLQLNEPGESSYVLGMMKQLKVQLEEKRKEMLAAKQKKVEAAEELQRLKQGQLKNLDTEYKGKTELSNQAKINLYDTKRQLRKLNEKIPKLQKDLEQTQAHCTNKQKSWQVRGEDRAKEKAALKEAIAYLTVTEKNVDEKAVEDADDGDGADMLLQVGQQRQQGPASLLQLGAAKGASWLAEQGLSAGSLAAAIAAHGGRRHTDAVKKVVDDMISVLVKQQAEDDTIRKECKANLKKKEEERDDLEDTLNQLKTSIEYRVMEIATMTREADQIEKELKKIRDQVVEARTMRRKERDTYEAHSKDRKLAMKVLRQAVQVMKQFYATEDKTKLLQAGGRAPGETAPPKTWDHSSRKDIASYGVMAMLDRVMDDILQEQKDADIEEEESVKAFEELEKEKQAEIDDFNVEMTDRMKRKGKMTGEKHNEQEEQTQATEDKQAVDKQLETLHGECDELLANYDKRKKARQFELSQLKDVLDILHGSMEAVRTGGAAAGA